MAKVDVSELDIFYISYDEPNAEEHWADLLNKVPWAKRVHGVKGFDAAHKACANQSETERFITVDGDNIVMDDFFEQELDFPETDHDGNDIAQSIFSWNGKNILNGLVYGNGGLKCWPTEYTKTISTHEAATDGEGMEFCWKLNYIQLNDTFSEVHQTASPFQAFRAGFREGVKMSLDQGKRVKPLEFRNKIWYGNYNRLQSRPDNMQAPSNIAPNFNGVKPFGNTIDMKCPYTKLEWDNTLLHEEVCRLGKELNEEINEMMLFDPNEQMCKFFKTTYVNPKRWGVMIREKQIQDMLEKGLIGK